MAFKKDENGNSIISPKQQAVLLYGQRLRGVGNVQELQRHLNELGYPSLAAEVRRATEVLKAVAKKEYENTRKDLDPKWESPMDKLMRELDEQDQVM